MAILTTAAASAQPSNLRAECIQAGMTPPEMLEAAMFDPGVPDRQSVLIKYHADAMPAGCPGVYNRYENSRVRMQDFKRHMRWWNMTIWTWNSNHSLFGPLTLANNSGVGDDEVPPEENIKAFGYYKCTNGPGVKDGLTHIQALFMNTVIDAAGHIVAGPKVVSRPVSINGRNHGKGC